MLHAEETKTKRQGEAKFNKLDKEIYTKKHFRMFGGEEERVTLLCKNEMANVIIDQFGRDVTLRKIDDEHFKVNVDVVVSNQFLAWIIALEGNVVVVAPEIIKEKMKQLTKKIFTI